MVTPAMKEEWKCTTIDSGRLCAITTGIRQMLMLFADNLDTEEQLQHTKMPTMDGEAVQFY